MVRFVETRCQYCRERIRFWHRSQYVPQVNDISAKFWRSGGVAHQVCIAVYDEGVYDGRENKVKK
jgi:hypothetical protein